MTFSAKPSLRIRSSYSPKQALPPKLHLAVAKAFFGVAKGACVNCRCQVSPLNNCWQAQHVKHNIYFIQLVVAVEHVMERATANRLRASSAVFWYSILGSANFCWRTWESRSGWESQTLPSSCHHSSRPYMTSARELFLPAQDQFYEQRPYRYSQWRRKGSS